MAKSSSEIHLHEDDETLEEMERRLTQELNESLKVFEAAVEPDDIEELVTENQYFNNSFLESGAATTKHTELAPEKPRSVAANNETMGVRSKPNRGSENAGNDPNRNIGTSSKSGQSTRRPFGDVSNRKVVGITGGEKKAPTKSCKDQVKASAKASTSTSNRSKRTRYVTCTFDGYNPIATKKGKWALVCPSCSETRRVEYDEVTSCEECGLPSAYKSGSSGSAVSREWLDIKKKEVKIRAALSKKFKKEKAQKTKKAKKSPTPCNFEEGGTFKSAQQVLDQAEAKAVEAHDKAEVLEAANRGLVDAEKLKDQAKTKVAEAHAKVEALETENRGLVEKLKRYTDTDGENANLKDTIESLKSAADSKEREICLLEKSLSSAKESSASQNLLFEEQRGSTGKRILQLKGELHQAREALQDGSQKMEDHAKNIYEKRSAGQKRRWDSWRVRSSQEESDDLLQNAENQDKKEAAMDDAALGCSKCPREACGGAQCRAAGTAHKESDPSWQNAENQQKKEAATSAPPPGQQFRGKLQRLQDLGFTDRAANVHALTASTGSVDQAIETLLEGPPGAVAEVADLVDA